MGRNWSRLSWKWKRQLAYAVWADTSSSLYPLTVIPVYIIDNVLILKAGNFIFYCFALLKHYGQNVVQKLLKPQRVIEWPRWPSPVNVVNDDYCHNFDIHNFPPFKFRKWLRLFIRLMIHHLLLGQFVLFLSCSEYSHVPVQGPQLVHCGQAGALQLLVCCFRQFLLTKDF